MRCQLYAADRKFRRCIVMVLVLALAGFVTKASAFVHPGLLSSRAELDFVRTKIREGKDPWKSALAAMKSDGSSSLSFTPKAKSVLNLGAGGSEDALAWFSSCHASYSHALQYALTGNEANATKSAQIINAWASLMTEFKSTDGPLDRSWSIPMVCAAEILKHYWGKWNATQMAQFEKFLRVRINPGLPTGGNNWGATGNACRIAIGIYLDDKAIFDSGVASYRTWMSSYVKADGWCTEHSRDLCHSRMGLGAAYMAAEFGYHQGANLWDPLGDQRLMKSAERAVVLLDGHPHKTGNYSCSHTPNWPAWELPYNHFRLRLGKAMPETELFKSKFRPDIARFGTPWLSPTHAELGKIGTQPTYSVIAIHRGADYPGTRMVCTTVDHRGKIAPHRALDLQGHRLQLPTTSGNGAPRLLIVKMAGRLQD